MFQQKKKSTSNWLFSAMEHIEKHRLETDRLNITSKGLSHCRHSRMVDKRRDQIHRCPRRWIRCTERCVESWSRSAIVCRWKALQMISRHLRRPQPSTWPTCLRGRRSLHQSIQQWRWQNSKRTINLTNIFSFHSNIFFSVWLFLSHLPFYIFDIQVYIIYYQNIKAAIYTLFVSKKRQNFLLLCRKREQLLDRLLQRNILGLSARV